MKTAVILSLGMLLEKVDVIGFIEKLLAQARLEKNDPDFEFALAKKLQAMSFAKQFNLRQIKPENYEALTNEFAAELMQLLDITKMTNADFWKAWNEMLTIGNLAEKIKNLQDFCADNNATVYLYSDTNVVHVNAIAKACSDPAISLTQNKQPMQLGTVPLYVSFQFTKFQQGLIEEIVSSIRAQQFNKPDEIILIIANPEHVKKDVNYQRMLKTECDKIADWCLKEEINLALSQSTLAETLNQLVEPKVESSMRMTM